MDRAEFQAMLALDERHWWYRGRRRVVRAILDDLPVRSWAPLLDAGAGSGRTLDELAVYGRASGIELDPDGVEAARDRGHDVARAPIEAIPHPDASFEVVTCLDVLEHTRDDAGSRQGRGGVRGRGGFRVLTAPASPRLWSRHEVVNPHYRRYTRRSLRAAADEAGW